MNGASPCPWPARDGVGRDGMKWGGRRGVAVRASRRRARASMAPERVGPSRSDRGRAAHRRCRSLTAFQTAEDQEAEGTRQPRARPYR